jgi:ATP-independent RNA helicase DbpA
VAARGLDIPALPLVIISELSPEPESHLHRIGRTGRAGERGRALSIVSGKKEQERLERIEAYMGQRIERGPSLSSGGGLSFLTPPNRTLLILAGRQDKLRKGDVLGSLVKEGGIPPEAIGRIDLMQRACAVAVSIDFAQQALTHVRQGRIKNKRIRAQLLGS